MTDRAPPPPGTANPAAPPSPSGEARPAPAPRRGALLTLLATAGLAGAGLAWWRLPKAEPPVDAALWQQRLPRPEGGELALAGLRGRPLVLNFWATWCPPCVEELPLLDRFFAEQQANGWQVAALAVDQPAQVTLFLQRMPLRFPVALASASLARSLGNPAGGLPFTIVFDADGNVIARKLGRLHPADLARWLAHKK